MKSKSYYAVIMIALFFLIGLSILTLRGYGAATIWTDKPGYTPGETAIISGTGFLGNAQVTITISRPDSTADTIYAWTDGSGAFTRNYQLDGVTGTYAVTATDGTNTASTTFTDDKPTFSITIDTINGYSSPYPTLTNPIHLAGRANSTDYPGQISQYQVQVDWGDTPPAVDSDSTVNFVVSDLDGDGKNDDFSGTWSSSPNHNYATGGSKTIIVKLYHQNPPGAESGDAVYEVTIQVAPPTANMIVTTSPSGLSIVVDSVTYTAPQTFSWVVGSTHSIGTTSPQPGLTGVQYVWTSWSDGGAITHNIIVPSSSTTYTANFKTQYYLTVDNGGHGTPTGQGWYDAGSPALFSISPTTVSGGAGTQYVFTGWVGSGTGSYTGSDISHSVTMTNPITETAQWKTQYQVSFTQTGSAVPPTVDYTANTDPTGTVPFNVWVKIGSMITYTYQAIVPGAPGVRYVLTGASPASPQTVTSPLTIVGSYKTQYYLTVQTNPLSVDAPTGEGWCDAGTYASISTAQYDDIVPGSSRYHFNGWTTSDMTEITNPSATSTTVVMDKPKTVTANYVTQYQVTFAQSGVGPDYGGTVMTVDSTNYDRNGHSGWWDENSDVSFSFDSPLSVGGGKQYVWASTTGLSTLQGDTLTITASGSVTGNYIPQYYVTFDQTGVGPGFTGTVVTIDSVGYGVIGLPVSFWWDENSMHTFSFASPLPVDAITQYVWDSTTGLSNLQGDTLTITASGSVTGNYILQNAIIFDQTGVGWDFAGTVVTIDGIPYGVASLPQAFFWSVGEVHSFAFQSPLVVAVNTKQYVWTSTTGLSSAQSDPTYTVTTYGSIIGNYKTQYYLTVQTDPLGVDSPSGEGWYDENTFAPVSTAQYEDIVLGASRYRFNDWTTADMLEITDPLNPSTSVLMDKGKTVTASYVVQYKVTFDQTGVGTDFTGTVVIIDGFDYGVAGLPVSFWYDSGSMHSFAFKSPLVVIPDAKQYVWASTTGVSTLQADTITVGVSGSIIGNYKTQYYLTVKTRPHGMVPQPTGSPANPPSGWYDEGTEVTLTAAASGQVWGLDYYFTWWVVDASPEQTFRHNPITISMNSPTTATASYCDFIDPKDPLGDVNLDGKVDMTDLVTIARHFGAKSGEPNYNSSFDLDRDGRIDLYDLATAARNMHA